MSKHNHQHQASHHGSHQHTSKKKGAHKDWRLWVVVCLMLGGMAMYVVSFDESFVPGETSEAREPMQAAE